MPNRCGSHPALSSARSAPVSNTPRSASCSPCRQRAAMPAFGVASVCLSDRKAMLWNQRFPAGCPSVPCRVPHSNPGGPMKNAPWSRDLRVLRVASQRLQQGLRHAQIVRYGMESKTPDNRKPRWRQAGRYPAQCDRAYGNRSGNIGGDCYISVGGMTLWLDTDRFKQDFARRS
jgi:hypothetical protein